MNPDQQRILLTLALLDEAHLPIGAALARRDPETGDRRLEIYSGLVDLLGPAAAYRRAQEALARRRDALQISQFGLLPFRRPEALALRGAIAVEPGSVITLRDSNLNGVFYDDVEVYRTPDV